MESTHPSKIKQRTSRKITVTVIRLEMDLGREFEINFIQILKIEHWYHRQ